MIKYVSIAVVMLGLMACKDDKTAPTAPAQSSKTAAAVEATQEAVEAKAPTAEEIAAAKEAAKKKAADEAAAAKLESNNAVRLARDWNKDANCYEWAAIKGGTIYDGDGRITGFLPDQALCAIGKFVYACSYGGTKTGCETAYDTYTPEERRKINEQAAAAAAEAEKKKTAPAAGGKKT